MFGGVLELLWASGTVAEVASHWDTQSKSKWDYYGVVDDQNRPHQVAERQASMSPALLLVVIDALKDPNQDAAELAGRERPAA